MHRVTDSPRRKLLLISYWYPPAVGAAAERLSSFARYLPALGWDVSVVCAARGGATDSNDDESTVLRVADPMAADGQLFADYDPRVGGAPTWKRVLKRFVFPDRFVRWRKAAAAAMVERWGGERFDAILASFPPASAVQLALEARNHWKAPLVMDFRDRWLGPGGYEPTSEKLRDRHRALEREAVMNSAAVLAVSENMANAIAVENGVDRAIVQVVPNGYEPVGDGNSALSESEGGAISASVQRRDLTIAHVGTVIARNRPDLFFDALLRLKDDARLAGTRFRFVGNLSREYIGSIGLSSLVDSTGLVLRDDARSAMRDADALLLLVGDYVGRWGHNAKLFEYVQTGRPILCLEESAKSNDGELLKRFVGDRAFFGLLNDAESIASAVERLKAYVIGRPNAAMELSAEFREYSRERLAERVAGLFDALV